MHTARSLRVCALVAITTSAVVATAEASAAAGPFITGDLFGLAPVPGACGLYYVNHAGSGPAPNSLQTLQR